MHLSLLALFACTTPVTPAGPAPVAQDTDPGQTTPPVDSAEPDTHQDTAADTGGATTPPEEEPPEEVPDAHFDHLPVLIVDTNGVAIGQETKVDGTLDLVRNHDGTLTDLDTAHRAWSGPIGIEEHGSSSTSFPKYNYRIELRDESGEDDDYRLLEMEAEADWMLHGPYSDKSLVRNAFAYAVARELATDTGQWQPNTAPAELIVNDSYRGVYQVVERVERSSARLNLPVPAATAADGDITGGYIVKIDQNRGSGWQTTQGTPIDYVYPKVEEITNEQNLYIKSYWNQFEQMLASTDYADPTTGYPAWLDVDSFIDHYLVNELSLNVDAYRLSAYLYKDSDLDGGLLHAGPVWDFNLGFGNVYYCYCDGPDGWIIDGLTLCGYGYQYPPWWGRLLEDPEYTEALRCRWDELREDRLSDASLLVMLDEQLALVAEAEPRDHAAWGNIGVYVWPNIYIGATYADEVAYFQGWLLERTAWMDANLPGTCGG